jgi:hypothetical protein
MTLLQRAKKMILPGWWLFQDINGDVWVCAPKGGHFVDVKIENDDIAGAVSAVKARLA